MILLLLSQHGNLKLTRCTTPKDKPTDIGNIEFGSAFTDHMLTIQWSSQDGWRDPEIKPYGELSISPAAKVFHYAIEVTITIYMHFVPKEFQIVLLSSDM